MTAPRKARDQKRIGNCILAERRPSRGGNGYSRALHRLVEIDRLIADRFGQFLPPEHLESFLTVAAFCHAAGAAPTGWFQRYAPYALDTFDDVIEPIRRRIEERRWNLNVEAGQLLALTFDERQRLQIKTMWAADVPVEDKRAVAAAKKENDRAEKERKRKQKRKPRAVWLAEHSISRERQHGGARDP